MDDNFSVKFGAPPTLPTLTNEAVLTVQFIVCACALTLLRPFFVMKVSSVDGYKALCPLKVCTIAAIAVLTTWILHKTRCDARTATTFLLESAYRAAKA